MFIGECRSEAELGALALLDDPPPLEIRELCGADLAVLILKDCHLSPPFSNSPPSPNSLLIFTQILLEFPFLQIRLQRAFSRFVISTSLPKSVSSALSGTS